MCACLLAMEGRLFLVLLAIALFRIPEAAFMLRNETIVGGYLL